MDGMGWDEVVWNGIGSDRMGLSGIEWSGIGWDRIGKEWNRME